MKKVNDTIKVRGFFRAQIKDAESGKIVGDSGWCPNTLTNYGLNNACAGAAIGASGSCQVASACMATQSTAVDATQISLVGVENAVVDITPSTVATGTARCTGSFAGSDNSDTLTVGSIGLHSNTNSATDLLSGQTFTTSQMATNQNFDFTYEWQFS
jgi:hypothetical protein